MDADVRRLAKIAQRTAAALGAEARRATPPRRLGRVLRALEHLRQGVVRKLKLLVREHWDLAAFDVLFGSLKAFGVYPALYFAGLAWTIPLMESVPLNTQLWTAGYIVARGRLLSELGRLRYGRPLARLDALYDRLLRREPRDARHVHRFTLGGRPRLLRVRHSRARAWLARWRGEHEPGVVLQSELRSWVADPEVRFLANPLRANPFLYEAVLLAKLRATPEAHARLLAASVPDEPLAGEARALRATLGEAPMAALARLTQQAESLGTAVGARLGRSPLALCLRLLHATLCRAVRARLRELDDLRYRVLADRMGGRGLRASPHWGALCRKRAEVRAWVARAGRLAAQGAGVDSEADARRLARDALRDARSRGLAARRARAVAWLAGVAECFAPAPLPARGIGA